MSAPLPDPDKALADQDPCVLLACCVWGESRNQPYAAQVGVACVVRNRVALQGWRGCTYPEVILKPAQFDAFLPSDPNRKKLLHPLSYEALPVWETSYLAAYRVFNDAQPDVTFDSIYYFTLPLKAQPKKRDGSPAWGPTDIAVVIGGVTFCRPSKAVPGLPAK